MEFSQTTVPSLARGIVMKSIIHAALITSLICLLVPAVFADPVPTTIDDFFLPGSQPDESGTFRSPDQCDNCHGGYDVNAEPDFNWSGSMMAQAMRDPLFLATMSVANQDAPEVGDLCLRCHTQSGWLEGRSVPTDGSALTADDREGIHCTTCHRMIKPSALGVNPYPDDPDYTSHTYDADQAYLATITEIPPTDGNGMYVIDDTEVKRGPYLETVARHSTEYSPYHSDHAFCGTCHDVSNPVFDHAGGRDYVPNAFGQPADQFDTYGMFPVERTYSEWKMSDYNSEQGIYAPQFGGNLDYVASCQDCHMRDVTGQGADMNNAPIRDDLPLHDLTGGNTFVPLMIDDAFPGETNAEALTAGIARATAMLQLAATMTTEFEEQGEGYLYQVNVTNETGHKLPSGYPEGRRIWLQVRGYDEYGQQVYVSGDYVTATGDLIHDDEIKVYEIKPGVSTSLSPVVNIPAGPTFHFVLNDTVYKDNRIPPRGFTNANFEAIGSPVVDHTYADGQYWDVTDYLLPDDVYTVEAKLFYQTTSKEYVTFLRDENVTDDWGDRMYQYWLDYGMSAPVTMQSITDTIQTGGEPGELIVTLVPHDAPIVLPPGGGPIVFDAIIENQTGDALDLNAWTDALLPNGAPYGPLLQAPQLHLVQGQVFTATNLQQVVPANAPAGTYTYRAHAEDVLGEYAGVGSFTFEKQSGVGIADAGEWLFSGWPKQEKAIAGRSTQEAGLALSSQPNPFNGITTVTLHLDQTSTLRVHVYNVLGKRVATLADGRFATGRHLFSMDASTWASGIYMLQVARDGHAPVHHKMLLMK
jgi:Secretion system C-terminal sorting domain